MVGIIASAVVPHTPRMGVEETAPEFVLPLIEAQRELGEALRVLEPDLIVLQSSHWVSTFNWYVTANEVHEGVCIADEAPDLIPGSPYRRTGDPKFARALSDRINANDIPCGLMESPHFNWDYGAYVPSQYLDPDGAVPIILLPSVICSDHAENMTVGALVHQVGVESGKKIIFLASCALAHQVTRGPELWPSDEHQALDRRLIGMLCQGDAEGLADWIGEYSREAYAEMAGRPLAGLIGAMKAMAESGEDLIGEQWGPYGQSSGTGNASVCVLSKTLHAQQRQK